MGNSELELIHEILCRMNDALKELSTSCESVQHETYFITKHLEDLREMLDLKR